MGNVATKNVDKEAVNKDVNDYPIVMYTRPTCGYCKLAKDILLEEQALYREKDLELMKAMYPETAQNYINGLVYQTRSTSVPQIFICGEYIGGFMELKKLREAGKLWSTINKCREQYDQKPVVSPP
ncbi:unnamed protein product [Bursaphelenchus xylophilus]|uniref:(pine wood nematode) hypothetical protein n=1 Tax=Bursaphelenchus xylophilus TaxID=6326 RepID=A0A1I7SHQ3_BURXY|nr:unnamed protein product [Bursaphelenchus xylophilus]CAG9103966.1 unnamed protein product [Bursaphelenchus xylophilus]